MPNIPKSENVYSTEEIASSHRYIECGAADYNHEFGAFFYTQGIPDLCERTRVAEVTSAMVDLIDNHEESING